MPVVATTAAVVLATVGVFVGSGWPGFAAIAMIAITLLWQAIKQHRLVGPNDDASADLACRTPFHPISGLGTREPLVAAMLADRHGVLGVIALKDYDRLCAFDPDAGNRLLRTMVDRLRAMLPPSQLIAQIDRGHLAVWIGANDETAAAEAELRAISYALTATVNDAALEIMPEIALRHLSYDATIETPQSAISRCIASFAVAEGAVVAGLRQEQVALARDGFLLEQDLRQAISRGELHLAFQPLIDAGAGQVCGAEALLRWAHETGPVSPGRFVPIMEAAGLSREIGLWALNAALREAADWARNGFGALRVAVNVSGRQLVDDDLPLTIARTLSRHALGAEALEVELTESVALNDAGQAAQLVGALRDQGISVAIDDFGTGFSSLSTLRRVAFDKIKIDREFVTDVHRRPQSQAICQSIIALGRGLGVRVLAEGVEHRAELDWLRAHGCQHFQGYYFAPPMNSADFIRFVQDRPRLETLLAGHAWGLLHQVRTRLSS